jgi:hypothetical protein
LPDATATAELLASLADVLRRLDLRWYLFGAQAVVIWGRPRMTADVDVTVALEPENSSVLAEAMGRSGFQLRIDDSEIAAFVAKTRVLPFLHTPTRMPLDVVLAGPGLEQEFLARAELVDLGGVEIPVLSAEDLVVTKILAGRAKDLDDVAGILRERREQLDFTRIRATLLLIEQALGQGDLLSEFEAQLARLHR